MLFKTPQAATLAARSSVFPQQSVHSGGPRAGGRQGRVGLDSFKVQQAPGPEDVLWQVRGFMGVGGWLYQWVDRWGFGGWGDLAAYMFFAGS